MTERDQTRIVWQGNAGACAGIGDVGTDRGGVDVLEFPPPWPDRPWIYGNVIASANGIVTWTRQGPHDDPLRAIAGGDFSRPGRRADARLLHTLRASAEALAVGAQTLRDEPNLLKRPASLGADFDAALARFGASQARGRFPRLVVYSESGALDLDTGVFNTADLTVVVVTTDRGAGRLRASGSEARGIAVLVAGAQSIESSGLVHAHRCLHAEFGVRYLDCEGGMVALTALRGAGILDEIFVTVTAAQIAPEEHQGVKRVFDFEDEAARLVAEGRTAADTGYVFRRWRFNER